MLGLGHIFLYPRTGGWWRGGQHSRDWGGGGGGPDGGENRHTNWSHRRIYQGEEKTKK